MFVGRKKELERLERAYSKEKFGVFVIGGQSGSGKTALLEEFCKDKDNIFFTVSNDSGRANLMRFSTEILAHYKDQTHQPFVFWNDAFKYIRDMQQSVDETQQNIDELQQSVDEWQQNVDEWDSSIDVYSQEIEQRPIIVVMEELDELASHDLVFIDMLRKCIDSELVDSKIFLIVSSQDTRFLHRYFTAEGSKLFHRTVGSLMLDKFTLSDEAVAEITKQAAKQTPAVHSMKMLKVSADEVILREGEISSCMYKIIAGKVVLYFGYGTDEEYVIRSLKEGQSFGEYSLLTGKPGIYTAVAFTDMLVLRIGQGDFAKFIEMNVTNAVNIMQNMANMINVLKTGVDMLRGEAGSQP